MNVERYERIWMWGAGTLIVSFLAAIVVTAGADEVRVRSA